MQSSNPERAQTSGDVRPGTIALAFVAVSLPVLTHPLPPLTDYPNSLAGAHVIATIGGDADLQRFYAVEWRVIPNLMLDLVVPALARFMSIYAAGQAFIVMALLLILSGTLALHRALFRRWSPWPLAAAVLIYNEVLLVGVMNYIVGIGLALWALAAWIALRDRAWGGALAVSALFVVALFFCHLFALGIYGLGLLAFEGHRLLTAREPPFVARLVDFCAAGVPFLAAAVLLLMSPTRDLAGEIRWQLDGKLDGLLLVFTVYHHAIAFALIAVMAAALAWASWCGLLRIHPFGWALLIAGAAVYLAMPRVLFATHLADQRLPIALVFMLIAALDLDLRPRRVRQVCAALLVALLALRLGEVQLSWNVLEPAISAFRQSALSIDRGARVLVVHADRPSFEKNAVSVFGLLHAASLATIERSALVSSNFTVLGKHLLQARAPFRRFVNIEDRVPPSADWLTLAAGPLDESDKYYWSQWPLHYDYVYVLFTKAGRANPDAEHLVLAAEGWGFQLYRVIKKA